MLKEVLFADIQNIILIIHAQIILIFYNLLQIYSDNYDRYCITMAIDSEAAAVE